MEIREKIKLIKFNRLPEHEKYLLNILSNTKKERSISTILSFSGYDHYLYNDKLVFAFDKSRKEFLFDNGLVWHPVLDFNSPSISSREYFDFVIEKLREHFKLNGDIFVTNRELNKK